MAKRLLAVVLALCLALLLAGCESFAFQNINDLLRAPALGRGQDEIQRALADYLGEQPQYKYPKMGEWRSPLRKADLDGDGQEEAVLLYSLPESTGAGRDRGNNVYVAILEQEADTWTVVQDVQGLSTDVASLEVANLLADGSLQLLVGFANASLTAKTLALYSYDSDSLTLLYRADYSLYLIDDFTGRESSDLMVVSSNEQLGGLQMQYIPVEDGKFLVDQLPASVSLDSNMDSCEAIAPSEDGQGGRLLVVDGIHQQSGQMMSQFIYYSGGRFYTEDPNPLRGATGRLSSLLKSRDINGDGLVEIPLRVREITTLAGDKRMEYVEWLDFIGRPTDDPIMKQYGLLDSDRSVYIRLPADWRAQTEVLDGAGRGEWILQNRRTQAVLLELVVAEQGDPQPIDSVRVPGTSSTYLVYGSGITNVEREFITMTAMA